MTFILDDPTPSTSSPDPTTSDMTSTPTTSSPDSTTSVMSTTTTSPSPTLPPVVIPCPVEGPYNYIPCRSSYQTCVNGYVTFNVIN